MSKIPFAVAFLAGITTFVSPCFLPLLPGYLSWIVGGSPKESSNKEMLISLVSFVAGFTLIFIAAGASASIIGKFIGQNRLLFNKLSGLIIIVFGLILTGLIKAPFLYNEKRLIEKPFRSKGSNFVLGTAFALAWSPCVGIVLSGILIYASNAKTMLTGIGLLFSFSLGLGLCLILSGLFFSKLASTFSFIKKHYKIINLISGLLLISLGLLLILNKVSILTSLLQKI